MTSSLLITGISGIVAAVALVALLLDRSARARAWRRIAEERRWDHERTRR
jgi:uncharacterized membrane protein YsdA (DUF1294 family)